MPTPSQTNSLLVGDRQDLVVKQGKTTRILLPLAIGPSYQIQRVSLAPLEPEDPEDAPRQTLIKLNNPLEVPLLIGAGLLVSGWTLQLSRPAERFATEIYIEDNYTAVLKSGQEVNVLGDLSEATVRAQIRRQDGQLLLELTSEIVAPHLAQLTISAADSLRLPATLAVNGVDVAISPLYWEVDLIYPATESTVEIIDTPVSGEVQVITQHSYEGTVAEYPQYPFPTYPNPVPGRSNTYPHLTPFPYSSYIYQLYGYPFPGRQL